MRGIVTIVSCLCRVGTLAWLLPAASVLGLAIPAAGDEFDVEIRRITPQFGTRQKLTTIITNAPLEPDPVCDDELCNRCLQCADACPTDAIPVDPCAKRTITIRGQFAEYAKIVGWRRRWGCSGMLESAGGYKDIPMPDEEPSAEELLRYKAQGDPWQTRLKATSGGLLPYCGRRLSVCPAGRNPIPQKQQER